MNFGIFGTLKLEQLDRRHPLPVPKENRTLEAQTFTVRRTPGKGWSSSLSAGRLRPRALGDARYCVSAHRDSFEPRASHGLQQHPRHLLPADRHVPPRAVFLSLLCRLCRLAQSFGNDPNCIIGEGVQRADL